MAKTKKQKAQDDALTWLTMQGNKAMQNQNAKELKVIQYLITLAKTPDYGAELVKINKHMQQHGSMNLGTFMNIFTNPNAKPKTINQKANK